MDYDFRSNAGSPYEHPMYRQTSSSSSPSIRPMYGSSHMYPRVGQPGSTTVPPTVRPSPYNHQPSASSSSSSGMGIRVIIKPEYQITPPPLLSPHVGEIPRSNFQFDFEFEKKVLAEAEKDNPNWSKLGLENLPPKTLESYSLGSSTGDPVVNRYIASGLSREAVPFAVANYGDNPTKVQEFVKGFTLLREMGFSSNSVAEALAMYDNDTDKALAHFLNSSS